jgi:hypothetical protein
VFLSVSELTVGRFVAVDEGGLDVIGSTRPRPARVAPPGRLGLAGRLGPVPGGREVCAAPGVVGEEYRKLTGDAASRAFDALAA